MMKVPGARTAEDFAWRRLRQATEMAGRLAGKVCVITGTGGSMGRATALAFAREGASVVGCDVTVDEAAATVEMVRAAGGQMVSLRPCQLSDPAECARLVELAVSEFGRIDVLYNLAAREHFPPLEGFTDQEWAAARSDEVDLVFYLTRAAWPHLKASHGVIVNTASLNGSLSFKSIPVAGAHDQQGSDHRDDPPACPGGKRARNPRQLDLARPDREQRDPRAARGRLVGPRHARQDADGSVRSARRSGERRAVPRL
jgi:hypothetical protein